MVNLGEEAIRAPFSLAAEEEADNMVVALTSVALSGLTITPSVPPDAVSGGDVGWTFSPFCGVHADVLLAWGWVYLFGPHRGSVACFFFPFTGGGVGGGGLVEVVVLEVLERRGGLQLIDTHVVSHVTSR
jgi:hypothetical protein